METLFIVGIGVIAAIWQSSMKSRELSLHLARKACQEMNACLLDDTVSLSHLGLKRNFSGRIKLRRIYEFTYTDSHLSIHKGTIVLMGEQVEAFLLNSGESTHGTPWNGIW